jgi:two-component system chemotaxis response regulator CheB
MEAQDSGVTDRLGRRSTITCPDCDGTLWEMDDEKILRYRCHTGHAYTAECLDHAKEDAVEKALWLALKTLEESGTLAIRMAARAREKNQTFRQTLLEARAEKASQEASVIRNLLLRGANT